MFDFLYNADARDTAILDDLKYVGPETFAPWDWYTVALVPKDPHDGDGQDCEIQECRAPARFFRLIVKNSPNSVGEIRKGWIMSTGSGDECGRLIVALAKAVSRGMIGFDSGDGK